MGLLDQLGSSVLGSMLGGQQQAGGSGQQGASPILQIAMLLLTQSGGLSGLLNKLQAGGLGSQAASWVGTGSNESVSPDHLASALGQDTLSDLAGRFGLSTDAVASGLASTLPALIDHATPSGNASEGEDVLAQGLSALQGMFGNRA
ncbi:MAG: YidB family protein [Rhodocyclaceae bacterium]